jgi:heme/copper-type cytochrome/quinol oxidase subunit 2
MILTGITGITANNLANSEIPINWYIAVVAVIVAIISITVFVTTVYFIFIRGMEPPREMK